MRLHYLNEPIKYIADVPVDKQNDYIFTWYFDERDNICSNTLSLKLLVHSAIAL